VYRVEKAGAAGYFWGVGRARGQRASFLDKLGPRATREAMQEALDAWAARRGLRPADFSTQRRRGAEEGRHGQVETRGRVPLETLLRRLAWCDAAAAACAACAGLLAGLMAAAGLRGCAPAACGACGAAEARAAAACLSAAHAGMQAGLDAARTRAALERNIREGIYPDVPCGEEAGRTGRTGPDFPIVRPATVSRWLSRLVGRD
jgi:hypothetical protein